MPCSSLTVTTEKAKRLKSVDLLLNLTLNNGNYWNITRNCYYNLLLIPNLGKYRVILLWVWPSKVSFMTIVLTKVNFKKDSEIFLISTTRSSRIFSKYRGTSLKRTLTGQKFFSTWERCLPWKGLNWKVPKFKVRLF